MRTNTAFLQVSLVMALSLAFATCARNPVTGKRELNLMSQEQEIALGQQSHPSVVASMGLYDNKNLQAFMNQKGQAMAKISHRPDLPYQFYIVDSPVVNAFAVPGGFVYFTRGILAHFNNEAEFAGVLGHEIGHITARHAASQQNKQLFGTLGTIATAILLPQATELAQQGAGLLLLKYSRSHESQSDEIGVEYSSKIGYDAHQMANFFSTIKRISESSGETIPTFMSTHPDPGNRNVTVNKLATEYQAKNPANYQVNRDQYLRLVDGITYGEDPKQGFVENNQFYHPELRFQFPVPSGWQHQNSPEQFQMSPKEGKMAMILMLAKGSSLDEAAQNLVKELSLNVSENQKTTINGNPAYVLISQQQAPQQQGQPQQQQDPKTATQIATWLIQYNNAVYALHGLSAASTFNNSFRTFQSVAGGFKALSDPDKLNRKPERVLVKSVPRDGSFSEAMNALGMPSARLEELGTLNSMRANDRVAQGSLIKIIAK
ncbi:M48 family metalloprotease [Spirosoma rigui]|uniref:M48 family metalloprotease n=1 Tax=Spirosoma rigui TaxID=564064 RepID=UPI0009B01675|nr:M48 family metalloprotease [Spirosoma rigui]